MLVSFQLVLIHYTLYIHVLPLYISQLSIIISSNSYTLSKHPTNNHLSTTKLLHSYEKHMFMFIRGPLLLSQFWKDPFSLSMYLNKIAIAQLVEHRTLTTILRSRVRIPPKQYIFFFFFSLPVRYDISTLPFLRMGEV